MVLVGVVEFGALVARRAPTAGAEESCGVELARAGPSQAEPSWDDHDHIPPPLSHWYISWVSHLVGAMSATTWDTHCMFGQ